jgi:ABC-type Mn2+/Zn2+ transport system permease subunit
MNAKDDFITAFRAGQQAVERTPKWKWGLVGVAGIIVGEVLDRLLARFTSLSENARLGVFFLVAAAFGVFLASILKNSSRADPSTG